MEKVTTEAQFCVGMEYNNPDLRAQIEEGILCHLRDKMQIQPEDVRLLRVAGSRGCRVAVGGDWLFEHLHLHVTYSITYSVDPSMDEWLCNELNSNRFRGGVEWIQTGNG